LQDADALPDLVGANPASRACAVELLKPFVPEVADHCWSVNLLVYSVKRPRECRSLQHFGSLQAVKEADAASLSAVVTRMQTEAIRKHFAG
jgi:hypothetical protein